MGLTGFLFWFVPIVGKLLSFAVVVDALLSWVPYNENVYKIRGFLQRFTAPVTSPIRRLLSPLTRSIMIDITPIIAIVVIDFLQGVILGILMRLM